MHDRRHYRGPPHWWPEGEAWPSRRRPQPWASFGRRLWLLALGGFLLFVVLPSAFGALTADDRSGGVVALWLLVGALLLLGMRAATRTWRPISRLMRAADRLAAGDYSARVRSDGPLMTRPVLQSFNRMASQLQADDEQRRRLIADVGHELRTPLTVIRGDLEAMVDGVRPVDVEHLKVLLDDVNVVERLLDDLRTLSLAESGALDLHRESTDLGQLARDVVAGVERTVQRDVSFAVTCAPGMPDVEVDPVRIREVLTNLVVNAAHATPAGGSVCVDVSQTNGTVTPAPEAIVIDVRDTGPGIPADEVDRVFERFSKGAGSSGTGLGLTISRDLATAHGGTLQVAQTSSQGTVLRLTLPVG